MRAVAAPWPSPLMAQLMAAWARRVSCSCSMRGVLAGGAVAADGGADGELGQRGAEAGEVGGLFLGGAGRDVWGQAGARVSEVAGRHVFCWHNGFLVRHGSQLV